MTPMSVAELLTCAGLEPTGRNLDLASVKLASLALDSRCVTPGSAFIALRGRQADGKSFVAQALQRGASCVFAEEHLEAPVPVLVRPKLRAEVGLLADAFYGKPSADMQICGVTGTNGKTSVSRLIAQLLRSQGVACGVMGTLGVTLGDGVDSALNTTPDPIALHAQLAQWHRAGVRAAAMEVSSHALDQQRINGLRLHSAVFTNLSRDHLDYHGDMASYGAAKAKLFAQPGLRYAIINIDDDFGRGLVSQLPASLQTIRCSLKDSAAELFASAVELTARGAHFRLHVRGREFALQSPLRGDFNVMNLLLACAAALQHGLPMEALPGAVSGLRGIPGRMQPVGSGNVQVVVDYAHTPDALRVVLCALRGHVSGRLICVFGAGGDRDRGKRPLMGAVASELADLVVLTSDNPRSEDPQLIIDDIAAGCRGEYRVELDRGRAIQLALRIARPGDCVLIAGKGHETVQIIGTQALPFSDAEHAAAALAEGGIPCSV